MNSDYVTGALMNTPVLLHLTGGKAKPPDEVIQTQFHNNTSNNYRPLASIMLLSLSLLDVMLDLLTPQTSQRD